MSTLGIGLMALSPFIAGVAFWGALKGIERYNAWKYRCDVERRNARQELYGMVPFRGTKKVSYDDQH